MSDPVIQDFLDEANARMQKSVDATRTEFATVRTGRASPHLLDRIEVDYYGAVTPLRQLSQISASEARLDRKSTRLNSSHLARSRMPSSA